MTISPPLFPAVTVTMVRDRKIRTARRINHIARFVTVSSWKKIRAITPGARRRSSYWTQSCHCRCPAQLTIPQPRPVLMGALDTTEPVLQWADTHQWLTADFSETKRPSSQSSFQRSGLRRLPVTSSHSPLASWRPGLREVSPRQVTCPWLLYHC